MSAHRSHKKFLYKLSNYQTFTKNILYSYILWWLWCEEIENLIYINYWRYLIESKHGDFCKKVYILVSCQRFLWHELKFFISTLDLVLVILYFILHERYYYVILIYHMPIRFLEFKFHLYASKEYKKYLACCTPTERCRHTECAVC